MADVVTNISDERAHEEKSTAEIVFSGTMAEEIAAGAAAVLAIVSLAGKGPALLLPIAVIALGAALLFEGAAITSRFYELLSETTRNQLNTLELGSGMTAESMAGIFGITLGILSIFGLVPVILISAAVVGIGGCLILGAGANVRLNALKALTSAHHPLVREIVREAVLATTGLQVLIGLGGVTLGIIALTGVEPKILSEVAILGMSGSLLLSGTALAGRMLSLFRF
jgi:hypothetical protein